MRGECLYERRKPFADRNLDVIVLRAVRYRFRSDERGLAAGDEGVRVLRRIERPGALEELEFAVKREMRESSALTA